jgi:hypothetical protein
MFISVAKSILLVIILSSLLYPQHRSRTFAKTYTGHIGMEQITVALRSTLGGIEGYYFYEKNRKDHDADPHNAIDLVGYTWDDSIQLFDNNQLGEVREKFEGIFTADTAISGTWVDQKNRTTLRFDLLEDQSSPKIGFSSDVPGSWYRRDPAEIGFFDFSLIKDQLPNILGDDYPSYVAFLQAPKIVSRFDTLGHLVFADFSCRYNCDGCSIIVVDGQSKKLYICWQPNYFQDTQNVRYYPANSIPNDVLTLFKVNLCKN